MKILTAITLAVLLSQPAISEECTLTAAENAAIKEANNVFYLCELNEQTGAATSAKCMRDHLVKALKLSNEIRAMLNGRTNHHVNQVFLGQVTLKEANPEFRQWTNYCKISK